MTLEDANLILKAYTTGDSLLKHARSVSLVMEAYALKLGEDPTMWAATGLLHDADYEAFPEQHPNIIVKLLREKGENDIAYAISAHYTHWGNPAESLLDKALLACDELTGFIIAVALVRPEGINGMKVKSVTKKLKTKTFAASVDREEIRIGAELLGVNLEEHIAFIIAVLEKYQHELGIAGNGG